MNNKPKLYTENTPELRAKFEQAGIKFGTGRDRGWDECALRYIYADYRDDGVLHASYENVSQCTHTDSDTFFRAVCEWFGGEPIEAKLAAGDRAEFSDDNKDWCQAVFAGSLILANRQTVYCSQYMDCTFLSWKFARPVTQKPRLTRREIAEKFEVSEDFELED